LGEVQTGWSIKKAFEPLRFAVRQQIKSYNEKLDLPVGLGVAFSSELSSLFAVISRSIHYVKVEFQLRGNFGETRSHDPVLLENQSLMISGVAVGNSKTNNWSSGRSIR